MTSTPIAILQNLANEQHYEVSPEFYKLILGKALKYSSCFYEEVEGSGKDGAVTSLDEAEQAMLTLTCERAELTNNQRVLEIGCGWGSLSLFMAARYPDSTFIAVSNSNGQRQHIESEASKRGIKNLTVYTADIATWDPVAAGITSVGGFDRVVSVECFEHLRNHGRLFASIASWLRPGGALFVHVFCCDRYAYPFEDEGDDDWMARNFFSGGIMPSEKMFEKIAITSAETSKAEKNLVLEKRWKVNGFHYSRTLEDWLKKID